MCMNAVQIGEKLDSNLIIFSFFGGRGGGEGACSFPVGWQCHMNVQQQLTWTAFMYLFYSIYNIAHLIHLVFH